MKHYYSLFLPFALLTTLLLVLLSALRAPGQVYNGGGGSIPDNGNTGIYYCYVLNVNPTTLDTVYGLESVTINLTHPYDQELRIELVSPGGTKILLAEGFGYDGNNYTGTVFRDDATTSIFAGNPPFTGNFRPVETIGYINNGLPANGTWQLRILDMYPWGNSGTLQNWSLKFSSNPGKPYPFDSSNLALVLIDTQGQEIPDDPKIPVLMKIIDNGNDAYNHLDDTPVYDSWAGIEIRGSSSQMFLKKSYGFETWDSLGNSVDTSLLGMPKESDWILNANFSDKTLMRNALAYQTFMNMGLYATRYRFVEVFINSRYKGVYLFSEKIKRNKHRVDIAKLTPSMNSGDSVTGGYIVKIDKTTGSGGSGWASNYPPPVHPSGQFIWFQYEYPKSTEITAPQKSYIQGAMDDFESALAGPGFTDTANGFRKYAVEETFISYFLTNEFSKNVDGYRLSTFIHKERDSRGGKFRMGPVWDYDLAWHNADYCGGASPEGWAYQFPCEYDYWQVPFWWARLLQDTLYQNNLKCKWYDVRGSFLSNEAVDQWIDSVGTLLSEGGQQRNFRQWPILGIYVWPNPWPYPTTYEDELNVIKYWIDLRLAWLDSNLPGTCWTLTAKDNTSPGSFIVLPNPAADHLALGGIPDGIRILEVRVLNLLGQSLMTLNDYRPGGRIDVSSLPPGTYFLRLRTSAGSRVAKFIKASDH
jgi:subtilisin-like proprotein convertase family protein